MKYLYSEIFDQFEKAKTRKEKIDILRGNDSKSFRLFFMYLYSPRAVFVTEIPQYRPAIEPAGLNWVYLDQELGKLNKFMQGHDPNLSEKKRKDLLVILLETLHKDEADILVRLMKKDLGIKYLTPKIVQEAFPDIDLR